MFFYFIIQVLTSFTIIFSITVEDYLLRLDFLASFEAAEKIGRDREICYSYTKKNAPISIKSSSIASFNQLQE